MGLALAPRRKTLHFGYRVFFRDLTNAFVLP